MLNNKATIIGLVGIDKYEIIIYCSFLLTKKGKKVLIIDNSETAALTYCISLPGGFNTKVNKINYKGMDYLRDNEFKSHINAYDYIIIDYGFNVKHKEILECDKLVLVTDKQLHNIKRLRVKAEKSNQEIFLITKDAKGKDRSEVIKDIISEQGLNIKQYYNVPSDDVDKHLIIGLQYSNNFNVSKLSYEYREILEQIAMDLFLMSKKEYKDAYKLIKGGIK